MWKDAGGERADGVFFVRLDCLCLGGCVGWGGRIILKKKKKRESFGLDLKQTNTPLCLLLMASISYTMHSHCIAFTF